MAITADSLGLSGGHIQFIRKRGVKNLRITVRPDKTVIVTVPWLCSVNYAENYVRSKQNWIHKVFSKFDRINQNHQPAPFSAQELIDGQDRLFQRLEELAGRHGFCYRKVSFRNQKTRWGSCSSQNNINLNIHLLTLPAHLQDYILLHELVHTEHKNHSKMFWDRLDKVLDGKARQYNKEMRNYRTGVMA
ncbi:MAG: YgjP-like metallopeptidase domain-containing protein [Anaerohalosphaeraceae bacterium]